MKSNGDISMVGWPRGEARDCKSLYTGSNPVPTSIIRERVRFKHNGGAMSADDSTRPWGRYEVLQESDLHKVKCIYVKPGTRLSYQRHQKRAEHWFIVSGTATVTLNGESFQRVAGETVDVAIGDLHRIANQGSQELVFIEVQTGSYFGEDDIERIEDDYSR